MVPYRRARNVWEKMKVEVESYNASITLEIRKKLIEDVTEALQAVQTEGGQFVVNDTLWYWKNPAGAIRPTVVNSASYISKTFQNFLEGIGWHKEPTLRGQNFDAMTTVERRSRCYSIPEERFISVLAALKSRGFMDYGVQASSLYQQYVQSSAPFLPEALISFADLFDHDTRDYDFRVGLEFETGNIASSFRAIEKLQGLYDSREIDIGIFVTSKNKRDGAARIWPVSNRNGSFEELRQRRYDARRTYPHIDVSFLPDACSSTSKYIGENQLYEMKFTGQEVEENGMVYEVAVNSKKEEKLLPKRLPILE